MVRRRLISTERHLKASMEHLLSNSNGAHRLPHKASMVHHHQDSMAHPLGHHLDSMVRRLRRDSMVHHHQDSMAHHKDLHPASTVHPRRSNNMVHRRKANIK